MTLKQISITVFLALLLFANRTSAQKAFIENIGQVKDQYQNKRTDIIAKHTAGGGLNIFLSESGIQYQWAKDNELYRMDVKLMGANSHPRISKERVAGFREQYQLADIKGTAYSYNRITYHDIYPGIDWTFYFNPDGKLEHDFIIRPGGNVTDIKLQYAGADHVKLDRSGNLVATTKYGSISEPAPYSYELATNKKISSSYQLEDDILTFKTGTFKGGLVIDPVISWSTYFGGTEYDEIRDVKIGTDNFVYVVGSTNSGSNIATIGAHLTTFQGGSNSTGSDAFLAKFSADGMCIWSTYYGGSNVDIGLSLEVDTAGHLYMVGRTNSQSGIATTGSHQPVKAGTSSGYDAFVVKFDTSGSPVWGTYFGGTGAEGTESISIAADRYNNFYLAGNTQSVNMATAGAHQSARPGGQDGFLAKFNTSGSLSWATYYGTNMNDYINAVTTDTSGNIIITGHTQGTTGLSTSGAYLPTGNGGTDGFVAKFDSTGQRIWATYYGGSGYDKIEKLSTDSNNAIYLAGVTESLTDIASASPHQNTLGGLQDFCLAKLNSSGLLVWSTYYGGSENEIFPALTNANGTLYLTGETGSANNISTPDGIKPIYNNSYSEGVLAMFNSGGQHMWGTYLGGDATDGGRAITILGNETIFVAGKTSSASGTSTAGAYQMFLGGNEDGWLSKINMCHLPAAPTAITGNTVVCENSEQQYTIPASSGADAYVWSVPNGWVGTSTTDTLNVIAGANAGEIKVIAVNTCGASDTLSISVTVNLAPVPAISRSGNILSVSQTFSSYQWLLNGDPISGATAPTYVVTGNGDYTLQVSGSNGCMGISNAITVTGHTAINDLEQLGVKVYPNPFSQQLSITVPFDLILAITDLSGRIIYRSSASKGTKEINLDKLLAGNYLLYAYHTNGQSLGTTVLAKILK